MEPSNRCDSWRTVYPVPHHHHHHHHHHPRVPCPHDHHHHHHHHTVLCPIHHHHHHLITWHSHVNPTIGPLPLQNHLNLESTTVQNVAPHSGTGTLVLQEQDYEGLQGVEEGEEEAEPIFVLSDEWREFFAKSEAKRKLEKKHAKKKQKN